MSLQVVDLSGGFESDSDAEVPNSKRTPRDRSKRQRMTYLDDDSPGPDHDDIQVLIPSGSTALRTTCMPQMTGNHDMPVMLCFSLSASLTYTVRSHLYNTVQCIHRIQPASSWEICTYYSPGAATWLRLLHDCLQQRHDYKLEILPNNQQKDLEV